MSVFSRFILTQKADINNGLVGRWAFDEGSGTAANDSSNNLPLTLSLKTTPIWNTASKVGANCLNFFSNSYAQSPSSNANLVSLGGSQSLSVAAWLKTTTTPTQSMTGICISHAGQNDGQYDKGIGVTQSGKAGFYYFDSPSAHILSSSTLINDGNWHHVCATFNGQTKTAQMFVDGRQESQQAAKSTFQFSTAYLVPSFAFPVGVSGSLGTWESFSGSIDDIRYYNRALTHQDVKAVYSYASGSVAGADITTGLLIYYKLDDNAANTTVTDSSGNGHTGTATTNTSTLHVAGQIGTGAFVFDGATQDINTGIKWSSSDASVTIACWCKLTAIGNNYGLASTYNGQPGIIGLGFNNGSRLLGQIYDTNSNNITVLASTYGAMNDGNWHHVAMVVDGTAKTLQLYIDGIAQENGSNGSLTGVYSSGLSGNLYVAGAVGGASFPGSIDDIRFYNRALSQADITALFNFR